MPVLVSTVLSITDRYPVIGRSGASCGVTRTASLLPRASLPDRARCCSGTLKLTKIGVDLVDHDQRHVIGLHEIAGDDQQIAGPAGDRRRESRNS